jgi:uncharacterized protein YlzI (FlbEa/FlbD family)
MYYHRLLAVRVDGNDKPLADDKGNPLLYQVRFNPAAVSTLEETTETTTTIVMINGDTYLITDNISAVVKALNPTRAPFNPDNKRPKYHKNPTA